MIEKPGSRLAGREQTTDRHDKRTEDRPQIDRTGGLKIDQR